MRHPKHEPEPLNFPWKWVELWIERPLRKALEDVDACWRAEASSSAQAQRFREARKACLSALAAVEETRRLIEMDASMFPARGKNLVPNATEEFHD